MVIAGIFSFIGWTVLVLILIGVAIGAALRS